MYSIYVSTSVLSMLMALWNKEGYDYKSRDVNDKKTWLPAIVERRRTRSGFSSPAAALSFLENNGVEIMPDSMREVSSTGVLTFMDNRGNIYYVKKETADPVA